MKLRKGRFFALVLLAAAAYLITKELDKTYGEDTKDQVIPPDEIEGYPYVDQEDFEPVADINLKAAKLDI
ncbi:MAG: hypothetical protein QMB63_01460 [Clostridiaceae bacterium]